MLDACSAVPPFAPLRRCDPAPRRLPSPLQASACLPLSSRLRLGFTPFYTVIPLGWANGSILPRNFLRVACRAGEEVVRPWWKVFPGVRDRPAAPTASPPRCRHPPGRWPPGACRLPPRSAVWTRAGGHTPALGRAAAPPPTRGRRSRRHARRPVSCRRGSRRPGGVRWSGSRCLGPPAAASASSPPCHPPAPGDHWPRRRSPPPATPESLAPAPPPPGRPRRP